MSHEPIEKVLILGGGTAGWMTASVLLQTLGKGFDIQLIESDAISTVGVGEATIPSLQRFHTLCGIPEDLFIRETQATFKLGIQFNNWGQVGESYIHSFGGIGMNTGLVDFWHYWLKMYQLGRAKSLDEYVINSAAAARDRFRRASADPAHRKTPLAMLGHAFHFDAGLFAGFLRLNCEQNGVVRTEGKVVSVQTDDHTGFVTSVTMDSGETHSADLFIDCSGFRAVLSEGALKTGYDDWSDMLPANRAVTVGCEPVRPILPYTKATAHAAGWQWRIPLQHRVGNGHVYCSDYMSEDEATSILLDNLESPALGEPRSIRFVTGKRKQFWNKNVVTVGLSAGFIEPLESTSIHMIQSAVLRLVRLFPNKGFAQPDIDAYNAQTCTEFERVRDFIMLHYIANRRTDSAFWRHCQTLPMSPQLAEKIRLFKSNGRIFRVDNELFGDTGWLQVMLGQGIVPESYDPLADLKGADEIDRMLASVRKVIAQTAEGMPTHEAFIRKNCKAPKLDPRR